MKRVIDILILFAASAFISINVSGFTDAVVVILISVILTATVFCIPTKNVEQMSKREKNILLIVTTLTVLLWIVMPAFIFFAPIFVYNVVYFNRPQILGVCGVMLIQLCVLEPAYIITVIILMTIAGAIAYSTTRMEELEDRIKRLRDNSMESDIRLREQNKQLLINQNNEIHLATLKERNRIAREIHDNVGHMLTRSILQVGALATIYKEEPLHSQITGINETLNVAMNNIRESVHDIHDEAIDLKQAIEECTKEVQNNYNLKIDYDMSKNIPKDIKYSFIAITKEAMANIVKHSNGTNVFVVVREHPGLYQLVIEDDGRVRHSSKGDGIGISNMQERVDKLGGTMHINDENGFKIFISVPKKESR